MCLLRILIADDHAVARHHLRRLLEAEPDCCVCGEASNGLEAVQLAAQLLPDVVVLDQSMPGLSGLEAARRIRAASPATRTVMVSLHDGADFARAAAEAGISAWVPKGRATGLLSAAIRTAAAQKD